MEENFTYKSRSRSQALPSCTLNVDYFKRLYQELSEITKEGANIEISQLKKKETDTEEKFEKTKNDISKLYKVSIHVFGDKGQYFYGENASIFDGQELPGNITKVIFENISKFKAFTQKEPINRFRIEFDFTKTEIFDFVSMPSEATLNKGFISVLGENETWVSGAYNKITESLSAYNNKHGWLHRRSIYDLILWFLIIPLSFRVLYHINRSLPPRFAELSDFFKAASYLYFFVVILYLFRMVFNYARWVFPNIELIQTNKKGAIKHRIVLGAILFAIFVSLLTDIAKLFLF